MYQFCHILSPNLQFMLQCTHCSMQMSRPRLILSYYGVTCVEKVQTCLETREKQSTSCPVATHSLFLEHLHTSGTTISRTLQLGNLCSLVCSVLRMLSSARIWTIHTTRNNSKNDLRFASKKHFSLLITTPP